MSGLVVIGKALFGGFGLFAFGSHSDDFDGLFVLSLRRMGKRVFTHSSLTQNSQTTFSSREGRTKCMIEDSDFEICSNKEQCIQWRNC